jgi:hypothetical protein
MTTAVYLGIGALSQGWTLVARDLSQYSSRGNDTDMQHRQLKTAPELEGLILIETRRQAICFGVAAVTVREVSGGAQTNWEVAHLYAVGGVVPAPGQSSPAARV